MIDRSWERQLVLLAAFIFHSVGFAGASYAGEKEDFLAAWKSAYALAEKASYPAAARDYERALGLAERLHGPEGEQTAAILNSLATVYKAMGQYAQAESLYQRSTKIYEAKLGADHPDVADSLNNLAILYDDLGQYAQAESLYQRSLKIREARFGATIPMWPRVSTTWRTCTRTWANTPRPSPSISAA